MHIDIYTVLPFMAKSKRPCHLPNSEILVSL